MKIARRTGLRANILSAEKILIKESDKKTEIIKYMTSFKYKKKMILEKILNVYSILDPRQKIISLWRRFTYQR